MREKKKAIKDLTIVVPVFNEAESLPGVCPEILKYCASNGCRAIFVNDGSEDRTKAVLRDCARAPSVKILHHKVNRGYGAAIKTGLAEAKTTYVLTMDGDGQHRVSDVEAIYRFALKTEADMVVGNRGVARGADPWREIGKWLIRSFTKILMPLPVFDLNSGFKIYRTELAQKYMHVCPDSMAFSDVITLAFVSRGKLVLEYSIQVKPREAGRSTLGLHTAIETILEILNLVMLFNPLRVFLPVAVIATSSGVAWGLPILLLGRGISVGAMLALLLGALFLALGLIASQLSAIRLRLSE